MELCFESEGGVFCLGSGGGAGGDATGGGGGGVLRRRGGGLRIRSEESEERRRAGSITGGGGGGGDMVGGIGNKPCTFSFSSRASRLFGSFMISACCCWTVAVAEASSGRKGDRFACMNARSSAGGKRGAGVEFCGVRGAWEVELGLVTVADRGSLGCGCVDCVFEMVGCVDSLLFL